MYFFDNKDLRLRFLWLGTTSHVFIDFFLCYLMILFLIDTSLFEWEVEIKAAN